MRSFLRFSFPLLAVALGVSGCSTPGPTHAYLASSAENPIFDLSTNDTSIEIPSHLIAVNELYGIAYDPFTDHLFLRVFPGDFVRVIDRPARKPKRSFIVQDLPPGRGDLAIRSRDRHLFFAHPTEPSLLETTLYGRAVRTIQLENSDVPPAGVAYDQANDRLLILHPGSPARISTCDLDGKHLANVTLDRDVRQASLAYDSVSAEFYAPLLNEALVGVFDLEGRLLRTLAEPAHAPHDFIDVGQRSLLRLF